MTHRTLAELRRLALRTGAKLQIGDEVVNPAMQKFVLEPRLVTDKPPEPVKVSAPEKPVVEPVKLPPPEVPSRSEIESLFKTRDAHWETKLKEALKRTEVAPRPEPVVQTVYTKPKEWRFTVEYNDRGFIEAVNARPVT